MANRSVWLEGRATFFDHVASALVGALAVGWLLLMVAHDPRPAFTSRFECGSDPGDFLRLGELLEPSSLHFIVRAHCTNVTYRPDGWIELRYGGMPIDVEVRPVPIAHTTYFRIVSIGGVGMP